MPRPRRSDPWPSSSPTGSQVRGALGRIRRFATRCRLNVRRPAIVAPFDRLDPIDRSSRLVGPINPDGVAALAQASERCACRVRQPAGGDDKLVDSRAIAALQLRARRRRSAGLCSGGHVAEFGGRARRRVVDEGVRSCPRAGCVLEGPHLLATFQQPRRCPRFPQGATAGNEMHVAREPVELGDGDRARLSVAAGGQSADRRASRFLTD